MSVYGLITGGSPYFETSTAPMDVNGMDELLQNPNFANRLSDFQIRFFIWIDGFTEISDKKGGMFCTLSPARISADRASNNINRKYLIFIIRP